LAINLNRLSLTVFDIEPHSFTDHDLDIFDTRDVGGYVTVGLAISGFLLLVF